MPYESRWERLECAGGFQRIDEEHPMDFYIGINEEGRRVLLLLTDREAAVPPHTRSIHVFCRRRNDNRWALTFCLVQNELREMFSCLCRDIIEFCRELPDGVNSTEIVLRRFIHWQRLLEKGSTGLLDESAIKGLIGELLFLERFSFPTYGFVHALEGWVGPLEAPQDFSYPDQLVEVKTQMAGYTKIRISSAEQLDYSDIPLQLTTVTLSPATNEGADFLCLPNIVENIRSELSNDIDASMLFQERLLSADYFDREEYRNFTYRFERFRHFNVVAEFPRIVRSLLPAGIGSVRYELDLLNCRSFEITTGGDEE